MKTTRKIMFVVLGAFVLLGGTACSSSKQEVQSDITPAPVVADEAPVKEELDLGASSSGRSR